MWRVVLADGKVEKWKGSDDFSCGGEDDGRRGG